ncbi:Glycosyl phosphatidyl inositol anchor synthesis [Xylographa bjoerkii]|nr:Glycosyl phosphatidyl inositol anchor synthesis [Xylographa bjoerkii]
MARINRFSFLAIAVVFHIIYGYSIFDIYFVSPIVHGMKAYSVLQSSKFRAPAQRLVLFVGDGLRADKAFQSFPDPSPLTRNAPGAEEPRPLMPFLRSRVEDYGTFGVSHTRVPTESRPGHVALIAGLYEDVSAVMTGWKLNPVNFDSVFNRSRHTWSWGSPDILPMFKEGAVEGRVHADVYGEEAEDYTQDATNLDTWVFDKVEEMFAAAAENSTLNDALREDKNVFFLHLLGLDTTGHAYRPYSNEYLHNIKIVDQGVEKMTKLIEKFYGDDQTAFVFTADHGMSDMGSHGDGHPDNTRTPLIVWGSGVHKPVKVESGVASGHEDGFSSDWNLNLITRHDVAQADIAPLMAYLAGLELPVNSVGELPLDYLAGDVREQAEAALVNVQGILEIYRVKEGQKRATEFNYQPYPAFGDEEHSIDHRIESIRFSIESGDYETAIQQSRDLLKLGLEGLRYLQTYDWLFLRVLVTIGYLGWIAFAITTVIDLHVLHGKMEPTRTVALTGTYGALLVAFYWRLWLRSSPITYYAYAFFPIVFWEEIWARRRSLAAGRAALMGHIKSKSDAVVITTKLLASLGLLEALVLSYSQRWVFTICFVAAIFWPFFYGERFIKENGSLVIIWDVTCVLMNLFTLLPVLKVEDSNQMYVYPNKDALVFANIRGYRSVMGGSLMVCVGLLYLFFENTLLSPSGEKSTLTHRENGLSRAILGVQIGLIVLATIVTRSSVISLQAKRGLPKGNQVIGWIILVASLVVPFLHTLQPNKHYLHRLVVIFLTFSPVFVILTISYEGLFYFVFCIFLVTWVRLEHHVHTFTSTQRSSPPSPIIEPKPLDSALSSISSQLKSPIEGDDIYHYRSLTLSDARISLFFLFLLQAAFFLTGNVASVSSFSLDSVYRLIPVFDPFSQGALLILKLMIPFAVISANLGILNRRLGVAPSSLFMVVMAISDVMTLNFFWVVKDEGSWLDIGTSISHFVIASLFCVFVALLEFVSEVFSSGVDVDDGRVRSKDSGINGMVAENDVGNANGTATVH